MENEKKINKSQPCVFILWSNGFKHAPEIIDIIRNYPGIEIQKVFLYQTDNIKKFIDQVYAKDDIPKVHIRKKNKIYKKEQKPKYCCYLS